MHFVLLFVLCVGSAMATSDSTVRIVGGDPTTVDQYPYMANMQYAIWGIWWSQACGGTLITPTAVLSASHCYYGDDASSWRVILGTSYSSSGGETHTVSQIKLHAGFNYTTLNNDVAIVKLAKAATLSKTIGLAKVAGPNYKLPEGSVVYSIGWGTLSSGGSPSEQLRHVAVNVINQQLCAERYAHLASQPGFEDWPNITAGMLCIGIQDVGGKDACQGDSGGPVVHSGDVIVGITSWGYGCADPVYPGVNTRVSTYSEWIASNALLV